jgi:hypothetical protein
MIKFSKPVLFFLFATSLFLLGLNISDFFVNGFLEKKELFVKIANLFVFSSSAYIFYTKLYKDKT